VFCLNGHCSACVPCLLQRDGLHTCVSRSIKTAPVCALMLPIEPPILTVSSVGMSTATIGVPAYVQRTAQVGEVPGLRVLIAGLDAQDLAGILIEDRGADMQL
jgi:hypothetical protein